MANDVTTYYVGGYYEYSVDGSITTERKYYSAAGMRIVMRTDETLNRLLGDHLGSASMRMGYSGDSILSEVRYSAFVEFDTPSP